jgi:hypothetical protein
MTLPRPARDRTGPLARVRRPRSRELPVLACLLALRATGRSDSQPGATKPISGPYILFEALNGKRELPARPASRSARDGHRTFRHDPSRSTSTLPFWVLRPTVSFALAGAIHQCDAAVAGLLHPIRGAALDQHAPWNRARRSHFLAAMADQVCCKLRDAASACCARWPLAGCWQSLAQATGVRTAGASTLRSRCARTPRALPQSAVSEGSGRRLPVDHAHPRRWVASPGCGIDPRTLRKLLSVSCHGPPLPYPVALIPRAGHRSGCVL